MLHYGDTQVVFQEVPDEISLAISISGCDVGCNGCHSAFTWNPTYGSPLSHNALDSLVRRYVGVVSCVLFYGGEWQTKYLMELIAVCKSYDMKVALYTGREKESLSGELIDILDYVKCGRWMPDRGGLENATTNQKMFRRGDIELIDITYKFRR